MDLEGDDDEIVAAGAAILAQLRSPVGETLAVEEARRRIGGGEHRRPLLLLGPSLGFVLEVDVAAPAEQDQRDVERERGACNAHVVPKSLLSMWTWWKNALPFQISRSTAVIRMPGPVRRAAR